MRSLACLILFTAVGVAAEPAKSVYTSDEGKFTASFPSKTKRLATKETVNEKSVSAVSIYATDSEATYSVVFRDFPAGALDAKPATALRTVQEFVVGQAAVDEAKAGEFGPDKLPMRQFTYSEPKLFFRTQIVMNKSRVYEISVKSPVEKDLAGPAANALFAEFKLTTGTTVAAGPEEFTSKDGLFTVALPGKPKRESSKVAVGDDFIQVHRETQEVDGVAYVIAFNDYPAGSLDPDGKKVLEGVRNGNVGEGTVDEDTAGTFGKEKYPMREFTFTKDKLYFRNRIILVKDRLYQVMVVAEKEEGLKAPAVKRMYDTFKLTKKED